MGALWAGKGQPLHPAFFLVPGACLGGRGCDQKLGDRGPVPALPQMSCLASGMSLSRYPICSPIKVRVRQCWLC